MKNNWQFWVRILLLLVMGGIGWYFADKLPDRVPMHWNFAGEADGFTNRTWGLLTVPLMSIGLLLLFWYLPKLDPKREKYKQFRESWEELQTYFMIFMVYTYAISLYAAVAKIDVGAWVMGGIGLLFVLLGNLLGKIRQNYFVGIKVPWTLNNEEVWNKTHRVGGWCFVLAGLIMMVNAGMKFMVGWVFGVAMVVCLVVPIVYSYVIYRRIVGKGRN